MFKPIQLKMKYSRILVFIIILLGYSHYKETLFAQDTPAGYNYSYLTIRNGLCDNSIRAIYKDKNSFMWFGTSNGLDRYDGYDLKHYSTASLLPHLFIESNYINDIKEDNSNHLWVAYEAGIMRINLLQENIEFFKSYSGSNKEILSTPIQTIFIDDSQNLWIGKSYCLAYMTLNIEREIVDIQILKKKVDIRAIIKHGNEIWAGGVGCLFRFATSTPHNYISTPVITSFNTSQLTFNCLFSYGDYLWMGTQSGLYCHNTQNSVYALYQHNPYNRNSISSNFITDIDENTFGDIVVGTRNGVNIYQHNDKFVTFNKEDCSNSLNDKMISKVLVDENNNIWVGSDFEELIL